MGASGVRRVDVVLDVDGVLSPICSANPAVAEVGWWPTAVHLRPAGMGCWVSPDLVAAVNDLARVPGVRMLWLTSWRDEAPEFFAPAVGLDGAGWPVLDAPDTETLTRTWWKADAVTAHLQATDAATVVWVDDDIPDWVGQHTQTPVLLTDPRLRTVSPLEHRGLTPALVERVTALVTGAPADGRLDLPA